MTGHKKKIYEFIENSPSKLSTKDIAVYFEDKGLDFKTVKSLVKELLNEGQIEYSYELGNSFLTPSFNKFVKISDKVIVYPPHLSSPKKKNGFYYLKIENSTSFGRGNHPTTRLCLLGMEKALQKENFNKKKFFDLGCGTGILAIAAAFFGFEKCFAVDIDPVAVFDSKHNAEINNLSEKVIVDTSWPENCKFNLIAANLRPRGLFEFKNNLKERLEKNGSLVLSGFKSDEKKFVLKGFDNFLIEKIWEEKGWCGALLNPY
ncbi:MAG: 50S ribosomal protein L11 methyltransferase [Desulforegulaceae bacterium]|nr:50S ribosomal protein L11 methyltransferase [Desulforegulaceae bacterium]